MKRVVVGIVCLLVSGAAFAQAQEVKHIQGFGIALVLGEAQGSTVPEGLSAGGRKALADLKDFLPYKGYRVLDTQFVSGTENGSLIVSRLRGLDQDYNFTLRPGGTTFTVQLQTNQLTPQVVGQVPVIGGPQMILSTRVDMTAGETVVVGTSRVQGDKALILLLTAVPR